MLVICMGIKMKTIKELHEILRCHSFHHVDAHIHTHLCDGASNMNVKTIAEQAAAKGMTCIILTPHFHKQVSDDTAVLYTDTGEEILIALRKEIEEYYKTADGKLTILLSTEADILSVYG